MKTQKFFQGSLVGVFLVALPVTFLISASYMENTDCSSLTEFCPRLTDFFSSIIFGALLVALRYLYTNIMKYLAPFLIIKGNSSEKEYNMKIQRFCYNSFNFLYFLLVVIKVYNRLQPEPFFLKEFGGVSDLSSKERFSTYKGSQSLIGLASDSAIEFMKMYFHLTVGLHLSTLIFLFVHRSPFHIYFWETCAHTVLALEMVIFGYMTKHLIIGAILLLLHDTCDIFTFGCKMLVDTSFKMTTFVAALVLQTVWAYSRLYFVPKLIILPILRQIQKNIFHQNLEIYLSAILFCFLHLFNIYWFSLMVRSCWMFLTSGKTKDMHDPEIEKEKFL